ncbi:GTPase HflX [bacterium]|jgi:GTPase|nr:GTPase HflX [bacterium]
MVKPKSTKTLYHQKTLIVGIHAPYNKTKHIDTYYEEFINLVRTDQIKYDEKIFIKLRDIDNSYFFTKGKLEEFDAFCKKNEFVDIIISEPLTSQQKRNLEDYLECNITDRTELILEIFQKAAHSAEGQTQVRIAILQHKKSRLAGKGVHLGQQAGGIGVRGGAGETSKEKETRNIHEYILKLKAQLVKIQKSRETQRKRRLNSKEPFMCLIGYTNSGKSTILNVLAKADVLAEDKLFATLDTTTRQLYINKEKVGLISDTVGFIQMLPHSLIDAFKSTLSELEYADILIHVIDISDPNWDEHIKIVHEILEELEIDKNVLYVFNKIDKCENTADIKKELSKYKPHVITSALSKEGLKPLVEYLEKWKKKIT